MPARQSDKDNTITRVYKYGLVSKGYIPQEAIGELYRRNKLWNRLVEIDGEYKQYLEEQRCRASPLYKLYKKKLEEIEESLTEAFAENRKLRVPTGKEDTNDEQIEQQIKSLKDARRELWKKRNQEAKNADKSFDKREHWEARKKAMKGAVKVESSQISSYTAGAVFDYFTTAEERVRADKKWARLRFHSFDGSGFWHYRYRRKGEKQDGVSFADLFHRERLARDAFLFLSKDDNHKKPRIALRAKLAGGNIKAEKIYHEFDMVYHRPIPDGGKIKNGKILRTRTGDKFRYDLVLTVEFPRPEQAVIAYDKAIGVDIGFRQQFVQGQDRILVATLATPAGDTEKIYVPPKMLRAIKHINDLKSDLDKAAGELGTALKPLLQDIPAITSLKTLEPAKLERLSDKKRTSYIYKRLCASFVKAPPHVTLSFEKAYKLSRALLRDEEGVNAMLPEEAKELIRQWWRCNSRKYREIHNLRARQFRRRKDHYREIAMQLVRENMVICVENNFLANISETKNVDNELPKKARANRVLAAPSELISVIENAALREHIPFVKITSNRNTSKQCYRCKEINKELQSDDTWQCQNCGVKHDRDENAAMNIAEAGLKKYKETRK